VDQKIKQLTIMNNNNQLIQLVFLINVYYFQIQILMEYITNIDNLLIFYLIYAHNN
jgi:hypothetical protein